jgi:hypothetical protein
VPQWLLPILAPRARWREAPYYLDIARLKRLLAQLEAAIRLGGPTWQLEELRDARDCTVQLIARARIYGSAS